MSSLLSLDACLEPCRDGRRLGIEGAMDDMVREASDGKERNNIEVAKTKVIL